MITFEAGQSELEYEMEIVDDDEWEPDEEFYVKVNIMMMILKMIMMMIIDMTNGSPTTQGPTSKNGDGCWRLKIDWVWG